jgi:hypothetical protein
LPPSLIASFAAALRRCRHDATPMLAPSFHAAPMMPRADASESLLKYVSA